MFWGIDRDMWITLWAGAVGGIPAAVLAALVAMAVLRRSNRKQQELVELQLKQQRREAALVREKAAIADLISSAMGLVPASRESPEAIHRVMSVFRSAAVRWQLELGSGEMRRELHRWESLLFGAAFNHNTELKRGHWGDSDKAFQIINQLTSALSSVAMNWHELDESSLAGLIADSRKIRLSAARDLEEMTGVKAPE